MATSTIKDNLKHQIDALNSKTYLELTKASTVDTFENYVYKLGNLLIGYVIFKPNADIGDTDLIVTAGVPSLVTSIQLPVTCVAGTQAGQTGRCRISTGIVRSWYTSMPLKAGNTYLIQINAVCV